MNTSHRDRVLTALRHQEPDRAPLFYRDVPEVEQRLLRDLHLADREALLQHLDIDFRCVEPTYIGPELADGETGRRRDIWGVEYQYQHFNDGSGYWEVYSNPLAHVQNPAELDDYPWPTLDWFDFTSLPDQCERHAGYAIMTAPGAASPSLLQLPLQPLVGMEKSLMDMVLNPDLVHALIDRVLAFVEPFVDSMLGAAEGRIDFFRIGDDYGTQNGLLFSTENWRTFVRPGFRRLKRIASKHGAATYLHSCGGIRELIPDLIDVGVDVLDPLQVKATGMVPAELKKSFGDQLCFCGGVDEQELLPTGTPDQVADAVHELLATMSPGGGYFIGPTHNFQDDIPTANIVAMYEAARTWSG